MTQRGSYAKGIAKREEILSTALDVIAREGYRGASVRELAQAVNLSQAGLLHYFGTKEELFTAVLRKRDEMEWEGLESTRPDTFSAIRGTFVEGMNRYAEVPGLVELYARLMVDAVDPEHPAHDMFIARRQRTTEGLTRIIEQAREAGRLRGDYDPEVLSRIMHAFSDGLLLQWMLDPTTDMAGVADALFELVSDQHAPASDDND